MALKKYVVIIRNQISDTTIYIYIVPFEVVESIAKAKNAEFWQSTSVHQIISHNADCWKAFCRFQEAIRLLTRMAGSSHSLNSQNLI